MKINKITYELSYTDDAEKHIKALIKSGNKASINKLQKMLIELENHPETGTGKPELMKYDLAGLWSRRIDHKNRLVYDIDNNIVTVTIISALGHYNDK